MKKILFVSDLDGTLLNRDAVLSETTRETLNRLIGEGIAFTYATARSLTTAREVTASLALSLPVIVYNGAFLQDAQSGEVVLSEVFSSEEAAEILSLYLSHGVYPRVYAMHNGTEKYSYMKEHLSKGTAHYLAKRQSDKRANPTDKEHLTEGNVFCFSAIDDYEKLLPLYESLTNKHRALLYQDPYTQDFWLEVLPQRATKADAVLALKELYGFEKVVVFGDEKNDLSMFAVADESYAVANANEEVKRAASGVIGSNDSDGVANFLRTFLYLS